MLPVITDLELLLLPVTVRVSAPSWDTLLPRVTSPVIVEVVSTLTASAPLPVVTSPVMLDAFSVRVSVLPLAVSPAIPSDTLPSTEEAALRLMLSDPEPVVIEPEMAVFEAVRVSPPSLLLLSLPNLRVLPVPPIVASVNVS